MSEVLFFNDSISLGCKVRILRIAKRWSQDDLAYEANVTQGNVSALERDLPVYPVARERILKVLGLVTNTNLNKSNLGGPKDGQ